MAITEHRLWGCPGTGKTSYITTLIGKIITEHGPDSLLVASFTKSAAVELGSRNDDLDRKNLGTLHSICYQALGRPKIAETHIKDFNEAFPHFALSGGRIDPDDPLIERTASTSADELFTAMQVFRARMVPEEAWPTPVQSFAKTWKEWKYVQDYLDFQDFIEKCLTDVPYAPGQPMIGLYDEIQDFCPLELSLIRKWAEDMRYIMLVGDDDQCIYDWSGASPQAFLNPPIPDNQKHVLTQSYRVPRAVHAASQAWIQQVSLREPKAYLPRDCEGEVRVNINPRLTWKNPELVLEDAQPYLDAGKSVMFLASCAFMLDPLKHALRAAALPFHNPYRRKRGDWNPLHAGNGVSSAQRLLSYLAPLPGVGGDAWTGTWTHRDVALFGSLLEAKGTFRHGMKDTLKQWQSDYAPMTPADWNALFLDDVVAPDFVFDDDESIYAWLEARLLPSKKSALVFPLEIARKRSHVALAATPQIVIGSVHSVKGGEGNVVYLFPDVSRAGMMEYLTPGDPRDSVYRLMYVGMTRAKESLILCAPASNLAVHW
jgi:superfamily I DNA/RNA helicase